MSEGKEISITPGTSEENLTPPQEIDIQDIQDTQTLGNIQSTSETLIIRPDTDNAEGGLEIPVRTSQESSQPYEPTPSSQELEDPDLVDMEAEFQSIIDRGFKTNLEDKINVNLVNLEKGSGQGFRKPWEPSEGLSASSSTSSLPIIPERNRYIIRAPRGSPTIDEMMRPSFFKNNISPEPRQQPSFESQTEDRRGLQQSSTPSHEHMDTSSLFSTNVFPAEHSTISYEESSSIMPDITNVCEESMYIREQDPMMSSTMPELIYTRVHTDAPSFESSTSEKDLQYKIKKYGLYNYSKEAMEILASQQTTKHDVIVTTSIHTEPKSTIRKVATKYYNIESASSSGKITWKDTKKTASKITPSEEERREFPIHTGPKVSAGSMSETNLNYLTPICDDPESNPTPELPATDYKGKLLSKGAYPVADHAAAVRVSAQEVLNKELKINPLQYSQCSRVCTGINFQN